MSLIFSEKIRTENGIGFRLLFVFFGVRKFGVERREVSGAWLWVIPPRIRLPAVIIPAATTDNQNSSRPATLDTCSFHN